MKTLIIFFFFAMTSSCESSNSQDNSITENITEESTPKQDENALKFINDYIDFINNYDANLGIKGWTEKQITVTENFKTELTRIITEAEKEDPEMGLGFDPILDAQDYPEKGFAIDKMDGDYVMLKGIGWEDFGLTLKMKKENGNWLVEGCGVVNVPVDKRMKR